MQQQIAAANKGIYEAAQARPECAGMGTTLVCAVVSRPPRISIGHIGDSRCYRLRADKFEQLTRDHSLLQEQIDSGVLTPEQAKYSLNKNLVTRALGIEAIVPARHLRVPRRGGRHLPPVLRRPHRHGRARGRARDRRREPARPRRRLALAPSWNSRTRTAAVTTSRSFCCAFRPSSCRSRDGSSAGSRRRRPLTHLCPSSSCCSRTAPRARRVIAQGPHHDGQARGQRRVPALSGGQRRARGGSRSSPTRSWRTSGAPTAPSSTARRSRSTSSRPRRDRARPPAAHVHVGQRGAGRSAAARYGAQPVARPFRKGRARAAGPRATSASTRARPAGGRPRAADPRACRAGRAAAREGRRAGGCSGDRGGSTLRPRRSRRAPPVHSPSALHRDRRPRRGASEADVAERGRARRRRGARTRVRFAGGTGTTGTVPSRWKAPRARSPRSRQRPRSVGAGAVRPRHRPLAADREGRTIDRARGGAGRARTPDARRISAGAPRRRAAPADQRRAGRARGISAAPGRHVRDRGCTPGVVGRRNDARRGRGGGRGPSGDAASASPRGSALRRIIARVTFRGPHPPGARIDRSSGCGRIIILIH